MNDALLLRIPEAARLCAVSKAKLYAMIHEGSVPIIRFGKSIRVPTESLRKMISDRTKMSGPAPKPQKPQRAITDGGQPRQK